MLTYQFDRLGTGKTQSRILRSLRLPPEILIETIRGTGNKPPLPALETGWQRGKID